MAITDVAEYAHLSEADLEALGVALESIRRDIENSRGARDRAYIQRAIAFQRYLEVTARLLIAASRSKAGCALGAAALATAKSIENMELGHNICHGQWDWMNDPEIHSSTWEWDMVGVSSQWRYAHNYRHHVFTNVIGIDDDLGYGIMRVTHDQQWRLSNLLQPLQNIVLATMFEWGIALQGWDAQHESAPTHAQKSALTRALAGKIARQAGKDYLIFPALSLRRWRRTLTANAVANLLRNVWAYVVICCGHFADGTQKFTPAVLEDETKPEWYLRQMLGTANFRAGPVLAFLSGNLCYQIEHHLFPDLPSNRYAQIAQQVRAVCARFDLPYTTGPLPRQYLRTLRTIFMLALPDRQPRSLRRPRSRWEPLHTAQPKPTQADMTSRRDAMTPGSLGNQFLCGMSAGIVNRQGGQRAQRFWLDRRDPQSARRSQQRSADQDGRDSGSTSQRAFDHAHQLFKPTPLTNFSEQTL